MPWVLPWLSDLPACSHLSWLIQHWYSLAITSLVSLLLLLLWYSLATTSQVLSSYPWYSQIIWFLVSLGWLILR